MTQKYGRKKRKRERIEKRKDATSPLRPGEQVEKEGIGRKWYLLLTLIMGITLLSYLNCFNNQFVFDDNPLIAHNYSIRGIEKIPQLLGLGKGKLFYRPVRMASYAVDYTLNEKLWRFAGGYGGDDEGLNPLGYHISNCIYHLVTTLLVFLVISRLVANSRIAFLAAALFALHPVHTDSVTYISGRRDIFFTLFYLAGFYFFLRYRQTQKILFILAAFFFYLLSLGSKEMGVTLPAIFLCYDLVINYPKNARRINLAYFKELLLTLRKVILQSRYLYSLIFLGALVFTGFKVFIKSPSFRIAYYGDSMLTTFLTVGKILIHYMRLMIYPINLNADYSYNAFPLSSSFLEPATFLSFIVLGITGYVVLRLMVTYRIVAFGVMWFFITLLPVCHIFPHHELLAEHYLYLPSFGFCLVIAYLLNEFLGEKRYRYYIYASFAAAVLFFSLRIVDRNRDWEDELTLWQKTVNTVPQCARAYSNLGLANYDKAMYDKAISLYKKASTIAPNYAQVHFNLGLAYDKKGMLNEAIAEYEKTISLLPKYAKAYNNLAWIYATSQDEVIRNGNKAVLLATRACELTDFSKAKYLDTLATACAEQGRLDKAMAYQVKAVTRSSQREKEQFKKRLQLYPNARIALDNLKVLYVQHNYVGFDNNALFVNHEQGELDKAIAAYEKAVDVKPNCAENHHNLGVAYLRKGKLRKAIAQFVVARKINPELVEAYMGIGVVFSHQCGLDVAIASFKIALDLKPDLAEAHNNLASTYYLKGDYEAAIYHCDQAGVIGHKVSKELLELLAPYR